MNGEMKILLKLLRQLICQWSFGTWRDAHVLRTLPKELRVLKLEELVQFQELGQLEEFSSVALRKLAVRALLKNLSVRALQR